MYENPKLRTYILPNFNMKRKEATGKFGRRNFINLVEANEVILPLILVAGLLRTPVAPY